MIDTAISWCDSTLNLEMGCDGCELWTSRTRTCYAGILTERYGGRAGWPAAFDKPSIFPKRLEDALRWPDLTATKRPAKPWLDGLPRIIFLNDMGDTFTESLPLSWLAPFLPEIASSPHQWLILTKRPKRMAAFFEHREVPRNVWLGTSVTDQATTDARLPPLLGIAADTHFLSIEPMLAPISISLWLPDIIDWVIVGGESGPGFRPMPTAWVEAIEDECEKAGVAFFYKQPAGLRTELPALLNDREVREMPRRVEPFA